MLSRAWRGARVPALFLAFFFFLTFSGAGAAERFVSVLPGPAQGQWTVTVEAEARPTLWLDGEPTDAVPGPAAEGSFEYRLTGVGGTLLGLGAEGATAAVRLDAGRQPFNDRIVYHIMMAYFANGSVENDRAGMRRWVHKNYAGGDLQGLLARADYLSRLGVNAVWLSPVFQSETSHGYDVQNYFRIGDAMAVPRDPEASMALFRQVVEALGERDIEVILDLPLDYGAGTYDRRAGDPNRRRPKHTRARQEAEKVWEEWGTGFKYWNLEDEDTRRFLVEVGAWWLENTDIGGFRLDYVRGVDHRFWAEFYAAMKAIDPGAFLFGEAWQDAAAISANMTDIAAYYEPVEGIGPQFDSLIEYPLQMVMTEVFSRGAGVRDLETWLQATEAAYGGHGEPLYFLDNHDIARFSDWAVDQPRDRLLAALTFMSSLPGPVAIFYGTEIGLSGSRPVRGFTDLGRIPMPWDDLDESAVAAVAEIFRARREHPVMSHGIRLPLLADDKTLVMARMHEGSLALVGVNLDAEARTVEFEFPPAAAGFEPLFGGAVPARIDGARWRWELAPMKTAVAVAP
ncbi:MAG: alpha-amylase family glycosyl hydrolase [Gammaproteobacteria bacterium]